MSHFDVHSCSTFRLSRPLCHVLSVCPHLTLNFHYVCRRGGGCHILPSPAPGEMNRVWSHSLIPDAWFNSIFCMGCGFYCVFQSLMSGFATIRLESCLHFSLTWMPAWRPDLSSVSAVGSWQLAVSQSIYYLVTTCGCKTCHAQVPPRVSLALVSLALLPPTLSLLWRPTPGRFPAAVSYALLTGFWLGYHVHEKAVLMVRAWAHRHGKTVFLRRCRGVHV